MNDIETTDALPPVIEPATDALPGGAELLEGVDDTPSLWDRQLPHDMSFFKMPLYDKLRHRAYHTVNLEGPFKLKQLILDHRAQTFRSEASIDRSGNQKIVRLMLRLDSDVFGFLEDDAFVIYALTPEAAQTAARHFRKYVKPQPPGKPFYYVVSIKHGEPNAEKSYIERQAPFSTEELELNYGPEFPAWEQEWRNRLYDNPSGLTLFHGPPGCGKTTYLRALMYRLLDKAVFYFIPVSSSEMLFDMGFLHFWMDQGRYHKNKRQIVLLEDAEELLLPRDDGNRDKVSNMLNLADGFIGDHLRLHVIATTNAPVRKLDEAIQRPGRLIGAREFRRLTRAEAQRLAQAKGLTLPDQDDFSLAEIYNGAAVSTNFSSERRVGFAG